MHQSMQRLGLCLLFEKKLKQAVHWLWQNKVKILMERPAIFFKTTPDVEADNKVATELQKRQGKPRCWRRLRMYSHLIESFALLISNSKRSTKIFATEIREIIMKALFFSMPLQESLREQDTTPTAQSYADGDEGLTRQMSYMKDLGLGEEQRLKIPGSRLAHDVPRFTSPRWRIATSC
jgi:hypothetical protein